MHRENLHTNNNVLFIATTLRPFSIHGEAHSAPKHVPLGLYTGCLGKDPAIVKQHPLRPARFAVVSLSLAGSQVGGLAGGGREIARSVSVGGKTVVVAVDPMRGWVGESLYCVRKLVGHCFWGVHVLFLFLLSLFFF